MLIEPSEQLCFETQLLLRLSLGFFFGERLLHIKDSLRKEAVVAQTNELGKLPAVQILGIPRPRLSPIKTVLVRSEKLFDLFTGTVCLQRVEGILDFIAHKDEIPPIALCFLDPVHFEVYLDAFGRTFHREVAVDLFLGSRPKFLDAVLQILLE